MAKSVSSEAKILTKHSLIYGMAPVLGSIVGFVMLPIYTRYLSPADYGVMELISITISILSLIIGVGIQAAVSRFYFDYTEIRERRQVVSTALLGYGSIAMLTAILLVPFSGILAKYILGSSSNDLLFTLALFSLAFDILLQIGFSYLRVEQKSLLVISFSITRTVISLSLNIYFVVIAHMGVKGIFLSTLISSAIFATIISVLTLKDCGLRVHFEDLKKMLKFGLPLMPSDISANLVHESDRFFLRSYSDLTMTGLYSLGYRLGNLVNQFVTSPFIQIWGPRRYENFGDEDSEKIYARLFTYFVAILLFVGLEISLFSKEALMIIADKPFWPAYKVVPIITLSYVIFSFNYHFNVGIIMKKATKYIAYVNVSNGIINLILNFILIKRFNIWGAAAATLICFIYKNSLMYYFSNKLHKIQVEWRRISALFLVSFFCYFAGIMADTGSIAMDLAAKGLISICFPLILYVFRFFTIDEIRKTKEILRARVPILRGD